MQNQPQPSTYHNQFKVPGILETAKVPEILAPVGGRDQFFAALNSGADAVFLGLKTFNARARAENFTTEDLKTLVPLAHQYGMRVLVTLNILIKDSELDDFVRTVSELEHVGVDALIVQDLGVAALVKKHFPSLKLHASTQMAVHNLAGVLKAYEWGFKRVVLARELTAVEIKRIRDAVPRDLIELEVFCHGSLCYSYSGLCFFSGAADARSGNRGECAYTCREPYKILSEPGQGFLFSMKDLDTAHKLDLMVQAGVDTLKIEGRKKDAQYVSSVVKLYRKKLNDHFKRDTLRENAPPVARLSAGQAAQTDEALRRDLKMSFQRQSTSFFFQGRYHENVIDLDRPSHTGIKCGMIESVKPCGSGLVLGVRLSEQLERFDGVRVEAVKKIFHSRPQDGDDVKVDIKQLGLRYDNLEMSFSVRDMALKGRKIFEALPGTLVEIAVEGSSVPQGFKPKPGDVLFKTRSASLKSRVEKISAPPPGDRLRPLFGVRTNVSAKVTADAVLSISISLIKSGDVVASHHFTTASLETRESGSLTADVRDVFSIYGDEQCYTGEFIWNVSEAADQAFVPKKTLKETKKILQTGLLLAMETQKENRLIAALQDISANIKPLERVDSASYELKIDRMEYLDFLDRLLDAKKIHKIAEIIFEPKKANLGSLTPKEVFDKLLEIGAKHSIRVRISLPTVIRAWDEPVLKLWLDQAKEAGISAFEVGNPGALSLLDSWGLALSDLVSDFTMYALNHEAVKFWQRQGLKALCLSVEDDFKNIESILGSWPQDTASSANSSLIKPVVILYKDTPLFVAESCSLTALHNGCPTHKVCGYRSLEIENSKGERFTVAHEGCKSIVYGAQAYSISGQRRRLSELGVERFRIDFLTRPYQELEFEKIITLVQGDLTVPETHPANFLGQLK